MGNVIKKIAVVILMFSLAKVGVSGRMWGDHGTLVATDMRVVRPSLCQLGDIGMVAAFPCFDEEGVYRAAVQGVTIEGELIFEDGHIFISSEDKWVVSEHIIAEPDEEGGVFVIWQVLTDIEDQFDVYAQHLDADLRPVWDEGGVLLYSTDVDITTRSRSFGGTYHGITTSDDDGLIVVARRQGDEGGGTASMHMLGGAVDFSLVLLVEGVDQHKAMQYYEFYDQFRQVQIIGWRPYIQLYDEQDDPIYTRLIQNNPDPDLYPSPDVIWPMYYGTALEEIVYDRGHFDIRPVTEYQYPVDELD